MPRPRAVRVPVPDPALPPVCFCHLEPDLAKAVGHNIVALTRGEDGYQVEGPGKMPWSDEAKLNFNAIMGVTEAQIRAMRCGSMFGWGSEVARVAFWERVLSQKVEGDLDAALRRWDRAGSIPPAELADWIESFDLGD